MEVDFGENGDRKPTNADTLHPGHPGPPPPYAEPGDHGIGDRKVALANSVTTKVRTYLLDKVVHVSDDDECAVG